MLTGYFLRFITQDTLLFGQVSCLFIFYVCVLNRYADLKNNRLTDYTFSFDQMLNEKVVFMMLCNCLLYSLIDLKSLHQPCFLFAHIRL